MRLTIQVALFCLLAANVAAQKVRVVVNVPSDTPKTDAIYVAGSLPSVGGWKADGVKLARQDDGTHAGEIDVEPGQTLEFKITRGTWETVEKNADGSERPNRPVAIDAATKRIDVTVDRWASGAGEPKPSTVVGTLNLHTIDSVPLKQSRMIRVWLPPGYDTNLQASYPVLYMHDGQNCFDRATSAFGREWEIDETLMRLIADKAIPPIIVVGIDNGLTNRINEYTYDADARRGGEGAKHAEFLLNEVKPFIEKTYRAKTGPAHRFIGGSSLGGVISLEVARRHPETFGGVIAMSPAIWWSNEALTAEIEKDAGGLAEARVWIDMGTREQMGDEKDRFVENVRRLDAALTKHAVEHRLVIEDGAEHNEPAWARRFPGAITYLLNSK